jgi:hypothetical protein
MNRTLAALAVCAAALIPYSSTLNDYFVQDDFGVVWLLSQKPWSSFPGWFVSTWMDHIWGYTPDEIRPFPAVTYQLASLAGAASPVLNHVFNVALHAANGLLVLAIAQVVAGLELPAATFAALVFVLLPIQAESVAWVTGRVDSMPAFFYMLAFLLYVKWRTGESVGQPFRLRAARASARHAVASAEAVRAANLYWASVLTFFVALFTKQNTITLGPTLVLYDLVLARRPVRVSWDWLKPYVPFAVLTIAYLALRYALFGEVARESQLTESGVEYFGVLVVRHLRRMVFGAVTYGSPLLGVVAALLVAVVLWAAPRVTGFFLAWWVLCVAPVVVAAYESPRHIYLASVAWAVILGCALQLVPRARAVRVVAWAGAACLLLVYGVQLARVISDWEMRALVSQAAVHDLEREALRAPRGALIIATVPVPSWEWALPFVLRPPFVASSLEQRVDVIGPQRLHCCRSEWEAYTRAHIRAWLERGDRPPVIALRWDAAAGSLYRLSEQDEPYLRPLMEVLVQTDSPAALERGLYDLANRLPRAR